MGEQQQITYMQVRLVRLAAEEWNMPIRTVAEIFTKHEVWQFIRECFGMFHVEGDYVVLDAIVDYLEHKGVHVGAEID